MTYKHRGQELLLHLWDVSSAEVDSSASSLHSLLCEDLDGIFFVFNVHRVSSIAAIDKWRHCGITPLLEMVTEEKNEQRQVRGVNAETQWRQLVKNMEAWNRIVMNLTQLDAQEGGNRRAPKKRSKANKEQRSESGASSVVRSVKTAEKISVAAVVVHLLKGNIGPGAMSLPNGFSKTGIYAGPVLFVVMALVSVYNMDLLLRCKQLVSPKAPMSFGDVGLHILGPKGKLLIDVFLVGTQLGICCVYFTFVATNIHVVLPESLQEAINERQLIFAIFPILLMLSWVRTLRRITPFSGLANFAVLSGIAIVFYYSIDYWEHPRKPREPTVLVDWSQIPEFYGTAVYSFEGIGLVLPIQNAMAEPERFPRVLAICMLWILVLFLFIGEVPTIAFGQIDNGSMTAVLHDYCEGWLVTMPQQSSTGSLFAANDASLILSDGFSGRSSSSCQFVFNAVNSEWSGAIGVQFIAVRMQSHAVPLHVVHESHDGRSVRTRRGASYQSLWLRGLEHAGDCLASILYLVATGSTLSLPSRIFHWGIVVFGIVGMVAGTVQAMRQVIDSFN
ncbi:WRKY transcription factor 19 [Phytophthora nicotianae]|uniref:WRKY transcription factor 19 n=1 Tax=Phytophthora nicotianae TaxID=4792 RepID=A0A0W8CUZ8_PHYNI|nr:WRKY transcription factor 19 [Phytophthora nicotianae]